MAAEPESLFHYCAHVAVEEGLAVDPYILERGGFCGAAQLLVQLCVKSGLVVLVQREEQDSKGDGG